MFDQVPVFPVLVPFLLWHDNLIYQKKFLTIKLITPQLVTTCHVKTSVPSAVLLHLFSAW